MKLTTPVQKLQFIGPVYAKRLGRLEIKTLEDFIHHFPSRYVDFSLVSEISKVQPGEVVTVRGQVVEIKNEYTTKGKKIQRAKISDGKGELEVVWFNQPFLVKTLQPGTWVSLAGKAGWFGRKIVLLSPEYETLKGKLSTVHTARLVPIYPETRGISSKWLRWRIASLLQETLPEIEEFLPSEILEKYDLLGIKEAVEQIHFPKTLKDAQKARERLAFNELLRLQLAVLKRKKQWQKNQVSQKLKVKKEQISQFYENLPFELTRAQNKAAREMLADLAKNRPMNRLLEGDVGSGKTVVAAFGLFVAAKNSYQAALMAPTQILALQHYKTLKELLTSHKIKIALLTSEERKGSQDADLVVGTHALIQKRVGFDRLALVVIDEQQRFGVRQRSLLVKKGKAPHVFTMTATPIPRTVALTIYGDLDLSVLDEMPPGRVKVTTWVIPPQKRQGAYQWIREQIKKTDSQAFIVCPLIEESTHETMQSVKAAKEEYKRLEKGVFPELKLGLLHGKLLQKEKEEVVDKFKAGKTQILVSTPVVEVGIDVPQATIMMVEGAERFGLSQLHQLRGRVGRREKKSYCLLFTESKSERVWQRLKALEEAKSGMELAELDLRLRGPGEIYGTKQHGFPELKIASFSDLQMIKKTKEASRALFPKLKTLPRLARELEKEEFIAPN